MTRHVAGPFGRDAAVISPCCFGCISASAASRRAPTSSRGIPTYTRARTLDPGKLTDAAPTDRVAMAVGACPLGGAGATDAGDLRAEEKRPNCGGNVVGV